MSEVTTTVVPFTSKDGRPLNLVHAEGERRPTKGPVLLVHGAGVRANIFRPPVERSIVDVLLEAGWDVWLENWRASIDVEPNPWTLDQAAVFDHPGAVREMLERTGADTTKAIIHCQGSTSFAMAAAAGLVPEVTTVVTNAVSLHPVIPKFSEFKIRAVAPMLRRLTDYIDCQWGLEAPDVLARLIVGFVLATHHECANRVCRMVSFTYGTGFPGLWSHENLNDDTHEWVKQEFAKVPMTFYKQMGRCVVRGHLVSVEGFPELPESFVAQPPQTDARFVFLAGRRNHCFLAESQERTFRFFDQHRPGYHSLHVFPSYGHLDVFMGKNAARDIGPTILEELER